MPTATYTRMKRIVHCTLRTESGALFFGTGTTHERALAKARENRERLIPSLKIPGWQRLAK